MKRNYESPKISVMICEEEDVLTLSPTKEGNAGEKDWKDIIFQ